MNANAPLHHLVFDPLSIGIGFAAGAVLTGLYFALKLSAERQHRAVLQERLESERAALGDHFKSLAQSALQSNNEQFLTLASERLRAAQKDGEHDLQKRSIAIEQMVKPVEAHLLRMGGMVEELKATDKTIRDDLQNLSKQTHQLSAALRNPAAQGKWGEFVLETILEKANLKKGIHYETQVTTEGGGRPDVVVNLPDGFKIAIDSKAPINQFIKRLDETLSEEESSSIRMSMARAVKDHVKTLGSRSYQDSIKGCDFVILFLPSEAVFSATLQNDTGIVDFAADNKVVIASPTLIISLLRVVGFSWRQAVIAENAQRVTLLGIDLHKRLSKFIEHFSKVGKNINAALSAYNDAVGSYERQVMPQTRKFVELDVVSPKDALAEIPTFENAPRRIASLQNVDDFDDTYTDKNEKKHG